MTKNTPKTVNRGRRKGGEPNPVDIHVGTRMRLRRNLLGYSQQYLARKLGLTFQQIQKYEKGDNRLGASRLWDVSKVLKVSMDFFFEDMDKPVELQSPMMLTLTENESLEMLASEAEYMPDMDPMHCTESLHLLRSYFKISNRKIAKLIYKLLDIIAKNNSYFSDTDNDSDD